MLLEQVWGDNNNNEYIVVQTFTIPSMCPEFDPDGAYTEHLTIWKFNLHKKAVARLGYAEAESYYRSIKGKKERLLYWRALKEVEKCSL